MSKDESEADVVGMKDEFQQQLEFPGNADQLGFVRSMFFGRLLMDRIVPYPTQDAQQAQRTDALLRDLEPILQQQVDPDRIDREEQIPRQVIEALGQMGVLGMTVAKEFGGGGFNQTSYCRVLERISRRCGSTAAVVGAHQSVGLQAIALAGSRQQKQRFLPDLTSGRMLAGCCPCNIEMLNGQDLSEQPTATLSEESGDWIINGESKQIANAAHAGVIILTAHTPGSGEGSAAGSSTAFIITPEMPGFQITEPDRSKCGIRGLWQGTLEFDDMRVPRDNVLGEPGQALRIAWQVMNFARCAISAISLGSARQSMELALRSIRKHLPRTSHSGEFDSVKQKVTHMAELCFAMDALTYMAAGVIDRGEHDIALETAIAKLFCSEALWQVTDDALQVFGSEGYMREHGLERAMRDARVNRIANGASERIAAYIAAAGMQPVNMQMQQARRAVRHPVQQFNHIRQFASHEWRDLVIGCGCGELHKSIAAEGQDLARAVRTFARDVERLLRKYRGNMQATRLSRQRIAASAVDLYAIAAVVSKLNAMLDTSAPVHDGESLQRELTIGKRFCHYAAAAIADRHEHIIDADDVEVLAVAEKVLGM